MLEKSFNGFVAAIIFGMGVHIGWGLIELIIWLAAKSVGNANINVHG